MDMLYLLALLACPLGMGLMMWFMMRGQHGGNSTSSTGNEQQQEVARLRTEVENLRKQQDPSSTRSS